ncbi:MAG: hypothetical protein GX952_07380 [Firmicutes bacterium]|nr:hypothetical protein [Bacillota bacterium]
MLQLALILWLTWLLLRRGQRNLSEVKRKRPLGAQRIIRRIRSKERYF